MAIRLWLNRVRARARDAHRPKHVFEFRIWMRISLRSLARIWNAVAKVNFCFETNDEWRCARTEHFGWELNASHRKWCWWFELCKNGGKNITSTRLLRMRIERECAIERKPLHISFVDFHVFAQSNACFAHFARARDRWALAFLDF